MKKVLPILITAIFLINLASAISITSVNAETISPGEEGEISITIENTLEEDISDVSVSLNLEGLPFIPIGSSEDTVDEIEEGDEETFSFDVMASNTITPGNYEVPYQISYLLNETQKNRSGTIGVVVKSNPILSFTATTDNPIVGETGEITLRIVNKGFFDARFVTVRLLPEGYTLLSEEEVYIGEVDSDDFETATFDVIFNQRNPTLQAAVEYKDFDNEDVIKTVSLPLTVYSREEALELGLIAESNTFLYVIIAAILIVLFFVWRAYRKRARLRRSKREI